MGGLPNVSSPTAVQYSGVAGAITGVILWILQTYVFSKSGVPAPIEGACWVLIPGAVTYVASLLTRQNTTGTAAVAAAPPLPPAEEKPAA